MRAREVCFARVAFCNDGGKKNPTRPAELNASLRGFLSGNTQIGRQHCPATLAAQRFYPLRVRQIVATEFVSQCNDAITIQLKNEV
jgi:hypothetical protein